MVLFFVGRGVAKPDVRSPLLLVDLGLIVIVPLVLVRLSVIEPEAVDIHRIVTRLVVMLLELASVLSL